VLLLLYPLCAGFQYSQITYKEAFWILNEIIPRFYTLIPPCFQTLHDFLCLLNQTFFSLIEMWQNRIWSYALTHNALFI